VEPIRDMDLVSRILKFLKERNERDYMMVLMGFNTGLRISDILRLTYKDIGDEYIYIREQKTKKMKEIPINSVLKAELIKYGAGKDDMEFLFKSRQAYIAITRQRAYQILQDVAVEFRINNFGTHSLRKTFGYHFYQKTKDVVTLQEIFNHSHSSVTLRYIGVNRQLVNKAYKAFTLS
jgi:integrase